MATSWLPIHIRSDLAHSFKSAEVVNPPDAPRGGCAIDGPGAFSAGDTLVPIPNTKVKTCCGDDTRKGKVARCRIIQKPSERAVFGVYAV